MYIWDGNELEKERGVKDQDEQGEDDGFNPLRWIRQPTSERIDLGGDVTTLCLARTGAAPVRPHMIAVNPAQTHVSTFRTPMPGVEPVETCGSAVSGTGPLERRRRRRARGRPCLDRSAEEQVIGRGVR